MLSKRDRFLAAARATGVLQCPVCGKELLIGEQELRCSGKHSYALNKKGCLNFLSAQAEGCYTDMLFSARRRVFEAGLYEPVADAIQQALPQQPQTLLDAGCGDGWYLQSLLSRRPQDQGAGIDISKAAILKATDWPVQAVWCVGDLRRMPFRDHSFDVVLDILTPANYDEFKRVLKAGGLFLKVFPGEEYLKEIREARQMPLYEEGKVAAYLQTHAKLLSCRRIRNTYSLTGELWRDLVTMTPLNQDLAEIEKEQLCSKPADSITIDLYLAVCRFS